MLVVFILFFIYLLAVVWVQVDHGHVPFKGAVFGTFVYPFVYLVFGIPYFLAMGLIMAYHWLKAHRNGYASSNSDQ